MCIRLIGTASAAHPRHQLNAQIDQAKLVRALLVLAEAASYAERTKRDRWEFAVEIHRLFESGMRENDLRFLVRLQLVLHARELKTIGVDGRRFQSTGDLSFTSQTCFVLTDVGYATAKALCAAASQRALSTSLVQLQSENDKHPTWNAVHRELTMSGILLKKLRRQADNQESILAVFQEEDWPRRIDDPLPPAECIDCKRRLNDVIKCLNRNHVCRMILFRGDGTGQGIIWESVN